MNLDASSPTRRCDRGGNVYRWEKTAYNGVGDSTIENRRLRGGNWLNYAADQHTSSSPLSVTPDYEENTSFGFRVASIADTAQAVPYPSQVAASLLLVGGIAGFVIVRRKNALIA